MEALACYTHDQILVKRTNWEEFMPNQKKEDILTAAMNLFSQHGFHAVGVDLIIQQSGVAKMTFYRHFPSKDELIQSVLIRRNENLQESIKSNADKYQTPMLRLKSVFEWYENWFRSEDFHGCMFIRASEEFRGPNCPIRKVAQQHKKWFVNFLEALLSDIQIRNSMEIAKHIVILLEGLTVKSNLCCSSSKEEVDFSWRCVEQLVSIHSTSAMAG